MTLAGLFGLLIFIYMRPPEFVPALKGIPFLYIFLGVTVVGLAADYSAKRLRYIASPQLRIALLLWCWCIIGLVVRKPDAVVAQGLNFSVSLTLYLVVAHGVQSVSSFSKLTLCIFALGVFVAFVAVHQGFQPFTCLEVVTVPGTHDTTLGAVTDILCPMIGPDGEPIEGLAKCLAEAPPGPKYVCELPGLFGTFSVVGRVRYLGVLQDPNEVALATSLAVPFAFSFFEQKTSFTRLIMLVVTLAFVGIDVVFTKSRGGQLVFSAVLGAYFMKKYGYRRGILVAALLAVPLLLLGGRSGDEAEQSSMDWLTAAAAGIRMFFNYPVTGVGLAQFTEHHPLTAHNAYILAVGELGLPGMCLFILMMIISIRIPIAVLRHPLFDHEVQKAKSLAMAMLAAFGGATIGIFFLSWTYHYVLWIHFGLSGSLYSVIKAKDPKFEVRTTKQDVGLACLFAVTIIVALFVQTKRKGAW